MKTIAIKIVLPLLTFFVISCGTQQRGSASDTSGTNGATNGTGKVAKSDNTHNYQTK